MMNCCNGLLFEDALSREIKEKFYYVDADPEYGNRLFFENSGGSLRLKDSVIKQAENQTFADCPERSHNRSLDLKAVQLKGTVDILRIILGAKSGALLTELSASQVMFQMVGTILENCPGDNAVTSVMEHPSSYDAVRYYCSKTGKDFRVLRANPDSGRIEVDEVRRKVTPATTLLSVMWASNITGAIMDLEDIVKAARAINPEIYIITDAVQHIPHMSVDVEALKLDGINFGPYKFFAPRGMGFGYVSDRVAALPHRKLLEKDASIWELGSPTPGNFAAMSAVVDYVCWLGSHFGESEGRREQYLAGMEHIHLHERALLKLLLDGTEGIPGLRSISGVIVYADYPDLTKRDLILAIGFEKMDCSTAVAEYRKRNVIVFERLSSSPYSKRAVEALGTSGVIRVSPMHCHTKTDIELFLHVTQEIAALT